MTPPPEPCPCGTALAYEACCAPLHAGGEPLDAVSLMRARYAAFVRGELPFLVRTLHPDHEDAGTPRAAQLAELRRSLARVRYGGLRVLDHDGPDDAGVWRVLFHVRVRRAGADASFVECSSFAHDGVGLRYVAGLGVPATRLGVPPSGLETLEGLSCRGFEETRRRVQSGAR